MPKLDLKNAIRIKGAGGEINALKGQGFSWTKPSGDVDPILAYFQSTGADGAYYPIWDKSTLFQDVDGTIPVENHNDPVALSLDVSGNGLHRRQPVSTRRPQYRTDGTYHWLQYDGIDDLLYTDRGFLYTASGSSTLLAVINFQDTLNDKRYSFEGIGGGDTQTQDFFSLLQTGTSDNSVGVFIRPNMGGSASVLSTSGTNLRSNRSIYKSIYDRSTSEVKMSVNIGAITGSEPVSVGTINTNTHSFGGVRRNTNRLFTSCREYVFFGTPALINESTLTVMQEYLASKTGVTL